MSKAGKAIRVAQKDFTIQRCLDDQGYVIIGSLIEYPVPHTVWGKVSVNGAKSHMVEVTTRIIDTATRAEFELQHLQYMGIPAKPYDYDSKFYYKVVAE